jgi:UPF0176 protein
MPSLHITAFYLFTPIAAEGLPSFQSDLIAFGVARDMRGLTLIAEEGVNGTVSGSQAAIAAWKDLLTARFGPIVFKDSAAEKAVFARWSVKIKPEIVALKQPEVKPLGKRKHLTPEEWDEMLAQEDVVVLDTRNDYEVALGKFAGAISPGIENFHEFPEALKKTNLPKDKKVMMYCTGGIRCEKALIAMERQGYEEVYQLEGGILAYLEKFPEGSFEGECFVFDRRTAVDRQLHPSKTYATCPHCGLPGDKTIACSECQKSQIVCESCAADEYRLTCSKRCANEARKNEVAV